MKVIKFGGKSLRPGTPIEAALAIVEREATTGTPPVVVVSARGAGTDLLLRLAHTAQEGNSYAPLLAQFRTEQAPEGVGDIDEELQEAEQLLEGIRLLGECTPRTLDALLSIGERASAKVFAQMLQERGLLALPIDAAQLILTDALYGNATPLMEESRSATLALFATLPKGAVPVVTGFIGKAKAEGTRTTLGRNGSNYTATLLANFLGASIVENYTHVDGIFTAHPEVVLDARKIAELSYTEAAELAQFGAEILHHKTLEPLIQPRIPLRIANTLKVTEPGYTGTLISATPRQGNLRALAALPHQALIHFEGRDMLGEAGIDARIFAAFERANVSAGMVSQGSTERGIGIVVAEHTAERAVEALKEEFAPQIRSGKTTLIYAEKGLAVVALVGMSLAHFDRPYGALVRNRIFPKLLNNAVTGNTLFLLLAQEEVEKALNVIHGEMFEHPKRVHIAVVGHGTVGGAFLDQVVAQRSNILRQQQLDLIPFAVANSSTLLLNRHGVGADWRTRKQAEGTPTATPVAAIIEYAQKEGLENLVLVDNTASHSLPNHYKELAEAGFDLVSSNKIANTRPYTEYLELRDTLARHRKSYRYETNVGAGLPLINNLRLLHLSGDRITRIRGLFSGSLSFIFNELGATQKSFQEVLQAASDGGYTEPDPRIDLSGTDVARKVLILARELELPCELHDVQVQNLVPPELQSLSAPQFWQHLPQLATHIEQLCQAIPSTHVPRYVGELVVPTSTNQPPSLTCSLQAVPRTSALGRVQGADSCFEIYTESYGELPIVIQGAGAGASVTARGVFGDLLRTAETHP